MNKEKFEQYYQKGGSYIIPVEILNNLLEEYEQLKEENTKLNIKLEDRAYEELKVAYEKVKEENFNLREYICIDKMSVPYKNDSFEELLNMPTYKEIQQQRDLYKSVLDEIREYITHEWFKRRQLGIIDRTFQEWELNDLLQILDKAKGE